MRLADIERMTEVDPQMSFSDKQEELEALGAFLAIAKRLNLALGISYAITRRRFDKLFGSMTKDEREISIAISPQQRHKAGR